MAWGYFQPWPMLPNLLPRSASGSPPLTPWQCDLSIPSCGQCVRARLTCVGYRNHSDLLFHDQTQEVASKAQRGRPRSKRVADEPTAKVPATSQLDFSEYSDAASSTIPSLPISAENQAFSFFFSNYPSKPSKNFGSVYEVIPALSQGATTESPLLCIVIALGLAGLCHHTETSGMAVAAYAWYDKALRKLNRSLRDRELAKQDQTLLVVLLLGLYETNTCMTPRSMRSWLNHIKGATALLTLRGEEQLDNEFGRNLFVQARTYVISGCYQTRSPVPDIVVQLSQKCRSMSADPVNDLSLIAFQFCNLRAEIPFHPPITQSESTTRTAGARCLSIAKALADWYGSLPAAFLPSSVSAGTVTSDMLSEYYDVYEDLWTAGIANNYRANSILVHEALISQLNFLLLRYPHDLNEVLRLETQISQSRSVIISLIDAICASVHSLIQSDFVAAGVSLLWPLYVSAQISPRSAPVQDTTRIWIIGRLETIGARMGVRQATMLAGILTENIEVTDLLKDE